MAALLGFVFFILNAVLSLLLYAIIANAILSWLVVFDIINMRNRHAAAVANVLDRVTAPVLAPFQRIIPSLGGVDISPIAAMLVIVGVRDYLLPGAHAFLLNTLA